MTDTEMKRGRAILRGKTNRDTGINEIMDAKMNRFLKHHLGFSFLRLSSEKRILARARNEIVVQAPTNLKNSWFSCIAMEKKGELKSSRRFQVDIRGTIARIGKIRKPPQNCQRQAVE